MRALALVAVLGACGHAPAAPVHREVDRDPDHDGVIGDADLCPNDPEDRDGFEDADGCPDPDNDHDRILDVNDKCPNDPETYNGWEDEDGCPDLGCVVLRGTADCIFDPIYFGAGSATLDVAYAPIVDAIASSLAATPELELVAIAGHRTANESTALGNTRAMTVVTALVSRGIAPGRLVVVDRGADDPHAPPPRVRRVDYAIRQQRVDPATADDVACTPVGVLGIALTAEQKRARCREQLHH